MQAIEDLNHQVAEQLEEKEKKLQKAKAEKEELNNVVLEMTEWLIRAEQNVGQKHLDLSQSQDKHQVRIILLLIISMI